MTPAEAEADARKAVSLLLGIHENRRFLADQMPANGKRAFCLSRFAAHDAAYLASRVVQLLSDSPIKSIADAAARPLEGATDAPR